MSRYLQIYAIVVYIVTSISRVLTVLKLNTIMVTRTPTNYYKHFNCKYAQNHVWFLAQNKDNIKTKWRSQNSYQIDKLRSLYKYTCFKFSHDPLKPLYATNRKLTNTDKQSRDQISKCISCNWEIIAKYSVTQILYTGQSWQNTWRPYRGSPSLECEKRGNWI